MSSIPIQHIFVTLIDSDPTQPRRHHDAEALQRLAETIKANGIEQPIRVRRIGDRFLIVYGERRWRGAILAGLESIPCIVEEAAGSAGDLQLRRLLENCGRADLETMEIAEIVEQAVTDSGLSAAEVARRIGKSESYVCRLRVLARASDDIQQGVRAGSLTVNEAYELARVAAADSQSSAPGSAGGERLSPAGLSRKLKRLRRAKESGGRSSSRITASLGAGRSLTLTGKSMSLDVLVQAAELLLARAKAAQAQGLSLAAFLKALKDKAAPGPGLANSRPSAA